MLHLTSPHSNTHSVGSFASKDQLRKAREWAKGMEVVHAQPGQTKAGRSWWWRDLYKHGRIMVKTIMSSDSVVAVWFTKVKRIIKDNSDYCVKALRR